MASSEGKIMRRRLLSARVSSILSMALVLLLVAVASMLLLSASDVSDYFKENMQISVVFDQQAREAEAMACRDRLAAEPWAAQVQWVSKEQGVEEMEEMLGKDFLTVFDASPIPYSLNVSLKAEYVTPQKMDSLLVAVANLPLVEDVIWQKSLVEALNANMRTISTILGVLIIVLMFISGVLIGNMVRLSLFNSRFTIHTMRLVGATKAFIRRPFLVESLLQGIVAALLADAVLLVGLLVMKASAEQLFSIFTLAQTVRVILITIAAGIALSVGTTFFVVGRMVRLKKEELYF